MIEIQKLRLIDKRLVEVKSDIEKAYICEKCDFKEIGRPYILRGSFVYCWICANNFVRATINKIEWNIPKKDYSKMSKEELINEIERFNDV